MNYGMKLPAVRLAATPVSVDRATPVRQSRSMVSFLALPVIPSATLSLTGSQNVPRLDPLHPPLVRKRTVCLETPAVHHHNHQRALAMQRKEHYRYHQVWRKPFYGTSMEREEYRKEAREHLKRQMEESWAWQRAQRTGGREEAQSLREADRLDLLSEREERVAHRRKMTLYRDENKRLMEQSWRDRVLTRSMEALRDKELLLHNPINWSGTLK